jgi:hypothetical protein
MPRSPIISEGVRAGLLGAVTVAAWFFVVDLFMGRPLYTPASLGEALMTILGPLRGEGTLQFTLLYTVFHVIAFMILGITVAWVMNAAEREPSHLAGLFILFVVFEVGFYLYLLILSRNGRFIDIAWYQIGIANLLAAVVMGRYLFRKHPDAIRQMDEALAGRT